MRTPRPLLQSATFAVKLDAVTALEWAGSMTGLLGAALLAANLAVSPLGWGAFLAANVLMICFAWKIRRLGLLVQQLGFMATSLLGIVRADYTAVQQLQFAF